MIMWTEIYFPTDCFRKFCSWWICRPGFFAILRDREFEKRKKVKAYWFHRGFSTSEGGNDTSVWSFASVYYGIILAAYFMWVLWAGKPKAKSKRQLAYQCVTLVSSRRYSTIQSTSSSFSRAKNRALSTNTIRISLSMPDAVRISQYVLHK